MPQNGGVDPEKVSQFGARITGIRIDLRIHVFSPFVCVLLQGSCDELQNVVDVLVRDLGFGDDLADLVGQGKGIGQVVNGLSSFLGRGFGGLGRGLGLYGLEQIKPFCFSGKDIGAEVTLLRIQKDLGVFQAIPHRIVVYSSDLGQFGIGVFSVRVDERLVRKNKFFLGFATFFGNSGTDGMGGLESFPHRGRRPEQVITPGLGGKDIGPKVTRVFVLLDTGMFQPAPEGRVNQTGDLGQFGDGIQPIRENKVHGFLPFGCLLLRQEHS